jgi:hypothetical protein
MVLEYAPLGDLRRQLRQRDVLPVQAQLAVTAQVGPCHSFVAPFPFPSLT